SGVVLGARRAMALGDREKFSIAQVSHGGTWQPRPSALRRLLWEIDKRTSIDVRLEGVGGRLGGPGLHREPVLYLAGDGAFAAPTDAEVARLRRHLQAGGFLLVDSAEGRPGGGFDQSVRALVARVLPGEELKRLADDHVIYKSFYLLHASPGRVLVAP